MKLSSFHYYIIFPEYYVTCIRLNSTLIVYLTLCPPPLMNSTNSGIDCKVTKGIILLWLRIVVDGRTNMIKNVAMGMKNRLLRSRLSKLDQWQEFL